MGRCSCDALERGFKLSLTYLFSHIGLCTLVIGYSIAGAFLFQWLEENYHWQTYNLTQHRENCVGKLKHIFTGNSSDFQSVAEDLLKVPVIYLSEDQWKIKANTIFNVIKSEVAEAVSSGEYYEQDWGLLDSLFYCVTVITTIGYGHHVPHSSSGKLATIFYAVFGIPLFLLTISNIGHSMASAFRFGYTRLCCCCLKTKKPEISLPEVNENVKQTVPYIPPPKYKPKRKKMVISPPISATLHRGSDLPVIHQGAELCRRSEDDTSSSPSSKIRLNPLAFASSSLEAKQLVAECAAYASSHIPGYKADPSDLLEGYKDPSHSTNQDYEFLPSRATIIEPSSTNTSPIDSFPSSPLTKESSIINWNYLREGTTEFGDPLSLSNESTPSILSPTEGSYQGDHRILWVDGNPQVERTGLKRPPGKTLVVYNTMSGDALQQQSKIARRMAMTHKKKHKSGRQEEGTVFVDPITGQTVDSNMMGLNYKPIPPKAKRADIRVPVPIVSAFVAVYITIGAFLFKQLEGWDLTDSAYFCFITLSTIGFGDLVPGRALGFETLLAKLKLATAVIYLLIGLAVLAMSFSLVQEEVILKCKTVAKYIGLMQE